jgi:pyrimidine deaminase RibD-like protein
MRLNEFEKSDYEIHDRPKLDIILKELCHYLIKGQQRDPIKYGMVAACVLDPKNRKVFGINEAAEDGTRRHAERVAMDRYVENYGEVPEGSIIITTLSPCNEDDTEMADGRYGESCTDLINNSKCRKVYCGYTDPTQHEDHEKYTLEETGNEDIKRLCMKFADTFLDEGRKRKRKLRKAAYGPGPYGWYGFDAGYSGNDGGGGDGGGMEENFADGKNPQDKGDSKRHGINTKASVSSLRKTAKQGGRKGQLAHWLANMKSGRAKKK